ncbi:MAG: BLUF domain-containing protein [Hyphomicrobiaceae bacterium]
MLVRCLYASRLDPAATEGVLDDILRQSRHNNLKRGITGMLCFTNGVFAQVIEGGRAEVSALLGRIFADRRHTDLQILLFEEIAQRRFGNWTMGQVNINAVNPGLLLKYSEKAELDPFICSGASTMSLLLEIADAGAIAHRPAQGQRPGPPIE